MSDDVAQINKDGYAVVKPALDGLTATILAGEHIGSGIPISLDVLRKELNKAKVVYGINEELLVSIINDRRFGEEFVIAEGKKQVDGRDGSIKYLFETSVNKLPTEDEKGNVDYKNLNLLQNVKKGQKLAEVIPPAAGKEGKTVTGQKILPYIGQIKKLPLGLNTEISIDNPNVMVAATEGNVFLKNDVLVQVDPVYVVMGDVDYNTGNIDYVGSLTIKGDVKAGFEVKTESELEIEGLVEDATIKTNSNVMIKRGFLGKRDGCIEAAGDVMLKYVENQKIIAGKDILVGEYVMNAHLEAGKKIHLTGQKGALVGGKATAKEGVEVATLGNYQEAPTEVIVGVDSDLLERAEKVEVDITGAEANLANVKKAIYKLIKIKMQMDKLPEAQDNLLKKLQALQGAIPAQLEKYYAEREAIEEEMKKYESAEIIVTSKVFPGVKIQIQKYKKVILQEMGATTFKIDAGEIQEVR